MDKIIETPENENEIEWSDDLITVHWMGYRKDAASRGHVWGYFTPKDTVLLCRSLYKRWNPGVVVSDPPGTTVTVFWGRIGKTFNMQDMEYTSAFKELVTTKTKNLKPVKAGKYLPRWREFQEEMKLYMLYRKIKNV